MVGPYLSASPGGSIPRLRPTAFPAAASSTAKRSPVSPRDELALRWKRAREAHAALDPLLEGCCARKAGAIDVHEAGERPAREVHRASVRLPQRIVVGVGANAHHEIVIEDSTAHVALQHE